MAKIINIKDFRSQVRAGSTPIGAIRFAQPGAPIATAEERTVSFVFSDASVDRYGDTIDAKGWVLDSFNANPVALFGHDASAVENVVGRAKNVRVQGDKLIGDIEFAEASVNPNAETVYQMVKGGYLNTVSVGFQPLEWVQTKDKARPGGIDFKKQELMEISIVPVPANPNAVALAKAAGIEVDRIALLERAEDISWSRDAAPIVNKKGLYAVSELADVLMELGWIVDSAQWEAEYEGDGSQVPAMLAAALKALGEAMIAMTEEEVTELLARFGGGTEEKEFTPVQKFVAAACGAFGKAKALSGGRKLTEAEIAGLKKAWGGEIPFALPVPQTAKVDTSNVLRAAIDERMVELGIIKAGKKLSAASTATLTDACTKLMDVHNCIKGMMDEPDDEPDDAIEKSALRARKAKAMKLRIAAE